MKIIGGHYCKIHRTIHKCGKKYFKYNPKLPTYLITRPIHDRILSYYKSKYKLLINYGNPTFKSFIDNLNIYYNHDKHHLSMIKDIIKKKNIKINYLLNLDKLEFNLNNLFNKYDINFKKEKKYIINSTSTNETCENKKEIIKNYNLKRSDIKLPIVNSTMFNKEIIKKIELFYKKDLEYYISNSSEYFS